MNSCVPGFDLHLVEDAAEKRDVGQLLDGDVGPEKVLGVEGDRQLLAGAQGQGVPAALQRDQKTGQHVPGRDLLPAQVVDDQHAALGLDVRRRLVEAHLRIVGDVKGVLGHLGSQDDGRTPDQHPAPVHLGVFFHGSAGVEVFDGLMDRLVEYADGLAVGVD